MSQLTLYGEKAKTKKKKEDENVELIKTKTLTGKVIEQKKRKKKKRGKRRTKKPKNEKMFKKITREGRWEIWGGEQGTLKVYTGKKKFTLTCPNGTRAKMTNTKQGVLISCEVKD